MPDELWVSVRVSNPSNPRRAFTVRALVDTGSADSAMPAALLRKIGIRREGTEEYEGWGRRKPFRRTWGVAIFKIQGKKGAAQVTFELPYQAPILGSVTMETLAFDIDMKNHRLKPFIKRKNYPRLRLKVPLRPEGRR